ncbi:MAG: energy transducer TonB [Pyrinomonadaceae bacterium]
MKRKLSTVRCTSGWPRWVAALSSLSFWFLLAGPSVFAQADPPRLRVASLSFGSTGIAERSANSLAAAIKSAPGLSLTDRELTRAAAMGTGYSSSLNLTTLEATDLGGAIGCEYYFLGDVQTLRRSPSNKRIYFDSYATIFIVSARTGRLVFWERLLKSAATADAAEKLLTAYFDESIPRFLAALRAAALSERAARAAAAGHDLPVIAETPEDDSALAQGFRPPAPYRRIRPAYTQAANDAEVEATVDVQVDLDITGEVQQVEIARWAGFGLDDESMNAVRQMHFRPAMRNGVAFPIRVLLRYNFKKPKE